MLKTDFKLKSPGNLCSAFVLSALLMQQPAMADTAPDTKIDDVPVPEETTALETEKVPEESNFPEFNIQNTPQTFESIRIEKMPTKPGVKIPPREQLNISYDESMEYKVYGEAIEAAKMLVTIDIREGKDHTESLMKLADAQSLSGDHNDAVSNYKTLISIREDIDRLALNLTRPYENLGKAYLRCIIERVTESDVDNSNLECMDTDVEEAFGKAVHLYHVNTGLWGREQANSLRGLIDLQVLRVNELAKLGLTEETFKGILKEVREADRIDENLYHTAYNEVVKKYGTADHPDILPALNERGKWLERSLRSRKAQKLYAKSIDMLEDLREKEIEKLIIPETIRIKTEQPGLKDKEAEELARISLAEPIAEVEKYYDDLIVPQLDRMANDGSNIIGDMIAVSRDMGLSPQMEAKVQQNKSIDAMEEMAEILENDGKTDALTVAQTYVDIGDSYLRAGSSLNRAGKAYKKAWEILRARGTEEEFNSLLLNKPAIIHYEQPTHLISRRPGQSMSSGSAIEIGRPIGRDYDGIYTVSYIFTVNANGRLKDFELDEQKTNAPHNVSNTQKLVLMEIARARPRMNWETGEFEDTRTKMTRQWEGENYIPGQITTTAPSAPKP